MRIGIQTWGSDGDINPFIALAGGLAGAGHKVTLAITSAERKSYARVAEMLGFELGTVDYIGKDEGELYLIGQRLFATSNPLKQLRLVFDDMFQPGEAAMYNTARSLCERNDLIIGHFIHYPIQTAAAKAGKPYITVTLNHGSIPTRLLPPPGVPDLGGWLNLLFWRLSENIINRAILPRINRLRSSSALPPVRSFRDVWESPLCNLIAVSREFCTPRPDWGNNQRVCGFFNASFQNRYWTIPEGLDRFLKSGPPPVYMTFGSMVSTQRNPAMISETTRLFVDAARMAGCRAIIQSRWSEVSGIEEDKNIYRIESAPYEEVFPHCAAVVHHGGAGTTQTVTMCGCPSVVVAHILDQYFWGSELKRLGIAPKLLDRRTVSPKKLAYDVRKVIGSPEMGEMAKRVGQRLRAEDGIGAAVKIIGALGPDAGSKLRTGQSR